MASSVPEFLMNDPADDFFRQDAKLRGMTLAAYEREFGVMVKGGPAEERIAYNELRAGVMGDDDLATAAHFERNYIRIEKRRRPRSRVVQLPTRRARVRAA